MRGAGVRPLVVLSGFLGSGKTTLLRRALAAEDGGGTAVLVNEVGEIGLDQHQFRHIAERTVLLDNGCLCCVVREDLVDALRELVDLEERGAAPRARRVVVETTGLADPGPIVATIDRDPVLGLRFEVASVVVTCDAEHARAHAAMPEWQAQVACADVIAITKADRAGGGAAAALGDAVSRRNPAARVLDARRGDPLALPRDGGATRPAREHEHHHDHTTGVSTSSATLEGPVDPALVTVWLTALLHAHGPSLLRVKALLDTGADGPLVLDAVQHTVYEPRHLPEWTTPRRSTLVAIARDLDARLVTRSFTRAAGGLVSEPEGATV
jgi:G3E family GTPase